MHPRKCYGVTNKITAVILPFHFARNNVQCKGVLWFFYRNFRKGIILYSCPAETKTTSTAPNSVNVVFAVAVFWVYNYVMPSRRLGHSTYWRHSYTGKRVYFIRGEQNEKDYFPVTFFFRAVCGDFM